METFLSIARWSKKQFGCSEHEQREKAKEELEEYMEDFSCEELADFIIASIGLLRFGVKYKMLVRLAFLFGKRRFEKSAIINAVNLKMEINRSRTWNGNKHVENQSFIKNVKK